MFTHISYINILFVGPSDWFVFEICVLFCKHVLRRCGSQFLDNVLADVVGPASEPAQADNAEIILADPRNHPKDGFCMFFPK